MARALSSALQGCVNQVCLSASVYALGLAGYLANAVLPEASLNPQCSAHGHASAPRGPSWSILLRSLRIR
eukprot:4896294-Alexandrium_andersonii.AAC.1